MDTKILKKEQMKLAEKVVLQDNLNSIKTIAGVSCLQVGNDLMASVTLCKYPSMEVEESQTFLLHDPLPHRPGLVAYREMPAIIEAYNKLEKEPDLILVAGDGVLHPRKFGIASHLGLALNKATIGVADKLICGEIKKGKIFLNDNIVGFEIKTREHSNPIYVSPGNLISLGYVLNIVSRILKYPHKMPEPIHLANKLARKKVKLLK
jgi:deoxyribonuclease V